MSSKKLNPFKDFQSDQIQRSSRKIFTAHYACRNAALNLTPVTGTTNGFIFQIINSLIESWGVRLTWFDCNTNYENPFHFNCGRKGRSKSPQWLIASIEPVLLESESRVFPINTQMGRQQEFGNTILADTRRELSHTGSSSVIF